MPESVPVSTPSSRFGAASYSRAHVSRLYWTLMAGPLWFGPGGVRDQAYPTAGQDLLRGAVRGALLMEAVSQRRVAVQQVPCLGPGPLPHQVGGLVPQPRLGTPAGLATLLQVPAMLLDRAEELVRPLA